METAGKSKQWVTCRIDWQKSSTNLMDNNVLVSCQVTGQGRSALEGVCVKGSGIEIPRAYQVKVKTGL